MKCEQCESEATVHLVEVSDGKKVELHLCEVCAEAVGTLEPTIFPHPVVEAMVEVEEDTGQCCPSCEISFQQFRRLGRLGCPECYEAFRTQLVLLLDRIHGATTHVGKQPGEANPELVLELRRHQLQGELDRAVTSEAYEEAARLRDEIREIEAQLGLHGTS